MQRPHARSLPLVHGSAVVVLVTATLLLLSGTTSVPGIGAACAVGLALGVLVAVTSGAVRGRAVRTSAPAPAPGAPSGTVAGRPDGGAEIRVPGPRARTGTGTRTGS
ncbi:hypothetical protein GCM10022244_25410 [Streptomyces gulbargensis]|uniref:Uncharacterized protein n=1 Tax=Streptomyces gulbargensis TaxID=364901 RepID=A0ABP7M3X1_9ACTN